MREVRLEEDAIVGQGRSAPRRVLGGRNLADVLRDEGPLVAPVALIVGARPLGSQVGQSIAVAGTRRRLANPGGVRGGIHRRSRTRLSARRHVFMFIKSPS